MSGLFFFPQLEARTPRVGVPADNKGTPGANQAGNHYGAVTFGVWGPLVTPPAVRPKTLVLSVARFNHRPAGGFEQVPPLWGYLASRRSRQA